MIEISDNIRDLIFSAPHIQESIFRHCGLSLHDLANASRVNRIWFQIVIPFLWENINITTTNSAPKWLIEFKLGLISHGRWTRTVTTTGDDALDWCSESPTCIRLSIIDATGLSCIRSKQNSMEKLVSKNPSLQVLRWHFLRRSYHQQFIEVWNALMKPNSRFLTTMDLSRIILPECFYELLKHHSVTMKHLLLKECLLYADETLVNNKNNEQGLNLKSLVLGETLFSDSIDWLSVDCFTSFIRLMNGLVELTLVTGSETLIEQVPRFITAGAHDNTKQNGPLALLELLDMKTDCENLLDEKVIEELLNTLPDSLSRLSLDGFLIGDIENLALRNFAIRKQDRLTSIKLLDCDTIASESWQTILTNCRYLKEVEGGRESRLEIEIGCKEPWVCLGLERFKMSVTVDLGWLRASEKFLLEDCEKLFSQLGALLQLKRLNIDILGGRLNSLLENNAKEEFLLFWSKMQVCTYLEEVHGYIEFPNMELGASELESLSREMWGNHVVIGIEVG